MKFLRDPVCGIAATGSARWAMAATWKMRGKTAPVAREDTLGTLSAWAARTKPATIAQGWPAPPAPAQADKEDGAAGICALARPGPGDLEPSRVRSAWPRPLALPAERRMEREERHPVSGLLAAPPRAGALHSSLLPASANLVEKRGTRRPRWLLLFPGWAAGYFPPPALMLSG